MPCDQRPQAPSSSVADRARQTRNGQRCRRGEHDPRGQPRASRREPTPAHGATRLHSDPSKRKPCSDRRHSLNGQGRGPDPHRPERDGRGRWTRSARRARRAPSFEGPRARGPARQGRVRATSRPIERAAARRPVRRAADPARYSTPNNAGRRRPDVSMSPSAAGTKSASRAAIPRPTSTEASAGPRTRAPRALAPADSARPRPRPPARRRLAARPRRPPCRRTSRRRAPARSHRPHRVRPGGSV